MAKTRFTRIPKTDQLIASGVAPEAFVTYCAIADHASNKNGLCWPRMDTLAAKIGRSVRTVQRHIHHLAKCGVLEIVHRRRSKRGRFSSYLFRVVAISSMSRKKRDSTTGHERPAGKRPPIFTRTKQGNNPPSTPPTGAYDWLFGEETEPDPKYLSKKAWEEHLKSRQDSL